MMKVSTQITVLVTLLTVEPVYAFLIPGALQSAHTNVGEIHGELANVEFDGRILQTRKFLGIPYAKPPVGDLRFRKPEVLAALPRSPFKALTFGSICPQPFAGELGLTNVSEDCLFLNVYAPADSDFADESDTAAKNPVLIWIHGGGFMGGFSDVHDGSILSAFNDVVVVTINYRLGTLGFFSTHDDNAPGNYGLWDQQLAIQWVRDNIAAFGGDPGNISIFGESAGGSSVVYQTLYPGNRGLVKRAIAQSGTISAWGLDRNKTNYRNSMHFAEYVGCSSTNRAELMACLRSKSADEMKAASEQYQQLYTMTEVFNVWVPVYDNDFVRADTDTVLQNLSNASLVTDYADTFRDIDLMIGTTNMDGLAYFRDWLNEMNKTSGLVDSWDSFTLPQFTDIVMPLMAEMVLNEKPTPLVHEAMKYEYTNWDTPDNATARLQSLVDMSTDFALNAPSILTAKGHQLGRASTYVYQFATAPPQGYVDVPPPLKSETSAAHADDLGFVFGFPDALIHFVVNFTTADINAQQMMVSKAMMAMWTNFAKSGNPNSPVDLQQFYNGLAWPQYDLDSGKYLEIVPDMSAQSIKSQLAGRAVRFWNELLPGLQKTSKVTTQ